MRKLFALLLIISIATSMCIISAAGANSPTIKTETELQEYYERHKDEQNFQLCFVWPEEVAFLGECQSIMIGNYNQLAFRYNLDSSMDDGSTESFLLAIYVGSLDMEEFISSVHLISKLELIPLEMDYSLENMIELGADNDDGSWHIVKRGKLEFIYESRGIRYIVWEQNGKTFRLEAYFGEWLGHSDHIFSDLLSTEPERFLEAQRQLLNIGNPNPVPPEPEKACGGDHVFGTQWKFDYNTHWYPCICGAKSQQGFHADENQDGACDICLYDLNGENVSDPVVDPVQPTQPTEPTEPVTQPTEPTQPPTAAPTAPPTQPSPAEPDAPSAGLWIGISAAVLATAAALLLLRKKK